MKKSVFLSMTAIFFFVAFPAWGTDMEKKTVQTPGRKIATQNIYVDLVTLHRYIKNPNGTYNQYNRKGDFFQIVSAELPLLTNRSHVIPVKEDCYLLYVKKQLSDKNPLMTLRPAMEFPPEGWFLETVLVDLKYTRH
jgi:hypothetical protein